MLFIYDFFYLFKNTIRKQKLMNYLFLGQILALAFYHFFCLFSLLDPDPHCRYKEKKLYLESRMKENER